MPKIVADEDDFSIVLLDDGSYAIDEGEPGDCIALSPTAAQRMADALLADIAARRIKGGESHA